MKLLRFLFFFLISFLLIGFFYWLLGKLFKWYMELIGFWFYFLMFSFAFLTYRFLLSNLAMFRLRKTIITMLGDSVFNWARATILILLSIYGCIYVIESYSLKTTYSNWTFIGYWLFILFIIQLTFNLIFQLLTAGDKLK